MYSMAYITVGVASGEHGSKTDKTQNRVAIVCSDTFMTMSPDMAEKLATDLLIQVDRIRKDKVWGALTDKR